MIYFIEREREHREILSHLGRKADECLMVGDDWEGNIIPAMAVGISGYWIAEPSKKPPKEHELLAGYGQLMDFWDWLAESDTG